MNKKCEVSVTVTVLLLLAVATFGGTLIYIWYTNYLKETGSDIKQVPPSQMASIVDLATDQSTVYVTIRNNTGHPIKILAASPVVGKVGGSGSHSCPLEGGDVEIPGEEMDVAVVPVGPECGIELVHGMQYYISIEVQYVDGDESYALIQRFTAI